MRVFAGISWPNEGYPAFLCILKEKRKGKEETFDIPEEYIEIIDEFTSNSVKDIFARVVEKSPIISIYGACDSKYDSFVYEYAMWRRQNGCNTLLRAAPISSFEAGILKIKEYVSANRLRFSEDSLIKSQLKIFSKLSLKNESEFFAVSALTKVINAFMKRVPSNNPDEKNMEDWY